MTVRVVWLFPFVQGVRLQCVIAVFPDHAPLRLLQRLTLRKQIKNILVLNNYCA